VTVANGEAHTAADAAVVVEEEHPRAVVVEMAVDRDLVRERVPWTREISLECDRAAEQSVHALATVEQIDTEIGDQHQVRLSGLDRDPRRHAPGVEIPGAGANVGFGPNRARAHRRGLRGQPGDPVGEQQRGLWHTNLAQIAVLALKLRPEDL
jgi:hypothetical protein